MAARLSQGLNSSHRPYYVAIGRSTLRRLTNPSLNYDIGSIATPSTIYHLSTAFALVYEKYGIIFAAVWSEMICWRSNI